MNSRVQVSVNHRRVRGQGLKTNKDVRKVFEWEEVEDKAEKNGGRYLWGIMQLGTVKNVWKIYGERVARKGNQGVAYEKNCSKRVW